MPTPAGADLATPLPSSLPTAERVAAALGTRVEVVAGAAHNPQFSHPERFNAILRDFLGG